ncbi:MAG: DNA alkylation repair protein, partial [Clostridia bacterium]|nr:DNA alkylation repair protein [Clostridia bacterium]
FNAVENIDCREYYVSMAAAWLLSICYVKHTLSTEKFMQRTKIDSLTFNRAIGKICDSYRVDSLQKEKMKKLKRKI